MKCWSESTFSGRPFHVYLSPSLVSGDSPFSGRAISTARCFRLLLHPQSFVQLLALGSSKKFRTPLRRFGHAHPVVSRPPLFLFVLRFSSLAVNPKYELY